MQNLFSVDLKKQTTFKTDLIAKRNESDVFHGKHYDSEVIQNKHNPAHKKNNTHRQPQSALVKNVTFKTKNEKDSLQSSIRGLLGGNYKARQIEAVGQKATNDLLKTIRMTSMKNQEAETYKKQNNLKLRDYLRLTSLSKQKSKSLRQQKTTSIKHKTESGMASTALGKQQSNQSPMSPVKQQQPYQREYEVRRRDSSVPKQEPKQQKKQTTINNSQGIKMVKNQTVQELKSIEKELMDLLDEIDNAQEVTDDEESLVFMCNVLNIFEEKIGISVSIAEQLVCDQQKIKLTAGLKNFSSQPMRTTQTKQVKRRNLNRSIADSNVDFYKSYSVFK